MDNVLVFLYIMIILTAFAYIIADIQKRKVREDELRLETEKFYYSIDFIAVEQLLDKMIEDKLAEYKLFNLEFDENLYINSELQMEMIKDITANVYNAMTPSIKSNISHICDVNDDTKCLKFIMNRVSIFVIAYVKETNKIKDA